MFYFSLDSKTRSSHRHSDHAPFEKTSNSAETPAPITSQALVPTRTQTWSTPAISSSAMGSGERLSAPSNRMRSYARSHGEPLTEVAQRIIDFELDLYRPSARFRVVIGVSPHPQGIPFVHVKNSATGCIFRGSHTLPLARP